MSYKDVHMFFSFCFWYDLGDGWEIIKSSKKGGEIGAKSWSDSRDFVFSLMFMFLKVGCLWVLDVFVSKI